MLAIADPADLDHGPRTKSGTERMCAVTRQVAGIDDLIRFVVSPAGEPVPDLKRKLPGRGLWVSLSHAAVAEAARRNVFAKSFKRDVHVSRTLADDVERMMVRSVAEALAMAAKAGQVVSGFSKVESAIEGRQAVALIHATDGAPDGIRKLNAKLAAIMRENAAESVDLPIVSVLSSDELDLALGRANVVHAALLAGSAGKTFLARCQTLTRFRMTGGGNSGGTDKTI
ncbi:RNA-binding protein [Bradyrhizobium sp. G127]|uniref:RNA-binding protein n=1 Tax=Bradyrhizobium sp. G127 TaxID=2904800 RepID=UPI001F3C59B1|nr:RNA-binding protein [Bradyrhizobium sp. G127]MCF2521480.1 RNA-binding protein [Bradyrhizobium sp. G127]